MEHLYLALSPHTWCYLCHSTKRQSLLSVVMLCRLYGPATLPHTQTHTHSLTHTPTLHIHPAQFTLLPNTSLIRTHFQHSHHTHPSYAPTYKTPTTHIPHTHPLTTLPPHTFLIRTHLQHSLQFDFDEAQLKLKECQELVKADFFLQIFIGEQNSVKTLCSV
jgi:hypothetical protein